MNKTAHNSNVQLWQPSKNFIQQSNLHHYQQWLSEHYDIKFENYADLWQWSIDDIGRFWESLWQYFKIIHHSPYTQILSDDPMPKAQWFSGATLNYAEHIFRMRDDSRPAMVFVREGQEAQEISWTELEQKVSAVQRWLRSQGIGKGDRVAAYLPNIPEAIICFLAINGLGAVWSCCSPDFGVHTVIDRFTQIEPKVLIAVDGYHYGGKIFDRKEEVKQIAAKLAELQATVLLPNIYSKYELNIPNTINWTSVLAQKGENVHFEAVPFEHPIWVLYSSGTTGKPKAITHSHGGVLMEHLKYMAFHNDAKAGENFFWFTTTGWMMWNFLQASMLVGAVPVLYDGSPGKPNLNVLWKLAEELPIHHFGTSAPYLTACMNKDLHPGNDFDLSALRSIGSTGAPLPSEAFDWIYKSIKSDLWLCSMSGGTDVCTAFVGGCPTEPVYQGHIQCRALGCALKAYNEMGEPIIGELGEMVIEKPMPSMPIYFWGDTDYERYNASYFEEYAGKWRHGDWINIFPDGSLIIQGRSDATLNRKGIRIGTAEIYSVLDAIPALKDSLILNLEQKDGTDIMPLFVVMNDGFDFNEALQNTIRQNLKTQCSPRHIPDMIMEAPDVPYTLSGKKMEVPVKKILMGMDISKSMNKDAVRNPDALDFFVGVTL